MNLVEETKDEWRELGFHYSRDDEAQVWKISGSKAGLLRFSELLIKYSTDSRNDVLFEHSHYGPYSYLKVITVYEERGFNENAIYGSLKDLNELGKTVQILVGQSSVGESHYLRERYSPCSEYELRLDVKEDCFDPPSIDEWLQSQEHK